MPHAILLGGVGGDSHSVGLSILRHALLNTGYNVHYLGTQNELEDFFQNASLVNLVMISSLDGHTRYYLRNFPELMRKYQARRPLWYLGGNLHIGDAAGYERLFREMGFDQVLVKFTDVRQVLAMIERDLTAVEPITGGSKLWEHVQARPFYFGECVLDQRVPLKSLLKLRPQVMELWMTGVGAKDIDDNAAFLSRQQSFSTIQRLVHAGKLPMLLQPRSGVPLVNEQLALFKVLKNAGARVLSYQVDSLTRNNNYTAAAEAIRESSISGCPTMNGFPVINHGVPGLRQIISETNVPIQTRHSTRDPRLLAEISYAGGVTSFEGGAICYNIPYYKDYPLDQSITCWQYVDRLTGWYYECFGIVLDREFFGTLTGTLVPPCLAIAVNLIEALLAVQQNVKCVSLGYAEQGNRTQDVAAIRTLEKTARELLAHAGYKDVQINTVFHQYMGAFPNCQKRSEELIYHSAATAALSGATRLLVKTPVEAHKIPTEKDNIRGLILAQQGMQSAARGQLDEVAVSEESRVIEREVQAILDSVIICGKGDIARGVVAGFKNGYIDIPFAPSIYNRGEVMTARDITGAVRFLSTGNLQFDRDLRDFHRHQMDERRRAENLKSQQEDYILVEQDVMKLPRGRYANWPLTSA